MNKVITSFLLFSALFLFQLVNAQAVNRCGSTAYLHAQMQADTNLATRMQQIEQFTQNYVQAHPNGNQTRAVITVPVVFHVLYNTTAQNISDAFCQAQINQLNLDYARLNTDASNTPTAFASLAGNTNIQFCLAVRDPNGAATTGIIHKQTNSTSFSTNDAAKYSAQGGDDAWPAASYLNIWSCNLGGGLLGYSQFPGGAAATDGCVILYNSIGSMAYPTTATPYNLGRTVTHEVGHWLNLYHVWGDDGGACTGTDYVADTPNQGSENYGCPTYPHTDNCTASSPGVMFMNYMDYVDDACMNMFSQGQIARTNALFATGGARVGILSSQGCVALGPVCATATGLTTTAVTSSTATFTWTATTGAASYKLQYRIVGTTTWTTVTVTGTTYNVTGLTANSNYEWQVQTICSNGGTASFTASTTFTTAGPPVANFVANVTSSCSGIIKFTDLTTGVPTAWAWNFGDGTTATLQNPVHHYFTNGTFTVTLTATNTNGTNTATKTSYITINKPAAPVAAGGSHCGPGTVSLSSTSTDTIKWYANAIDTTPVSSTNPFVTPSLSASATYYAEAIVPGTTASVGPVSNTTLGAGGYFSNSTNQYQIFSCFSPCTLKSVLVNAQTAGARVITLTDSAGNTLQTLTATLTTGANIVLLNFSLPVATNLHLTINGTANLYRNNAVTTGYPFTLAGLVSITTSSAGTGYYYYFYNWQIISSSCVSLRAPVTATITAGLTAAATATAVSCYGGNNGTASLTVSGGTPAYTYVWSNNQTTASLTNVVQGNYTVTVSDASGCSGTQSVAVSQPSQLLLSANATNATCGITNGGVSAITSGGTSAYTFHWSNSATTSAISNLSAGTFTVTVTDSHSCTASATASVISTGSLNITPTITAVACYGASSGSISVSASGGTAAYNYSWAGGQSGNVLSNLSAGSYTVSVSDANGCSATQSIAVTQPAQLILVLRPNNASCGLSNGSINSIVSGGTVNYAYAWNNGATTSNLTGLSSGNYAITVTDNKGCSASSSATIANAGSLAITAAQSDANCYGASTGNASVTVTGGTPTYNYLWSNGATTAGITSVPAANYLVTVTDEGNCSSTVNVAVGQPAQLSVSSHADQPLCAGNSNGTIFVSASGGTGSYTYLWNNTNTTNTISNLAAGTYTVTITDANQCTFASAITLLDPASLSTTFSTTNVACNGDSSGSISLTAAGGTPAYAYGWNTGSTGSTLTNLVAGSYAVTITDNHHCTTSTSVSVAQPNPITVTTATVNETTALNDGSVSVQNVGGATSPFTFLWSNGTTTQTATGLSAGTYSVTVTDANGCQQTAIATVNAANPTSIGNVTSSIIFNVYPNPAITELNVSVNSLGENGTLTIRNILGEKFSEEAMKANTTNTRLDVSKLAAGIYLVELRSGNNWAVKQIVIAR